MSGELVSIIVPVYNVEPYLRQCLDSIPGQTYQKIEIILIASESDDQSVEICEEYAGKDSRIRVIHQGRRGPSAARNAGLDASSGVYLTFVDGDDFIHSEYVKRLYAMCSEADSDLAQCRSYPFLRAGAVPKKLEEEHVSRCSGKTMCGSALEGRWSENDVLMCRLYKKELFDGIRFPEGKICEDTAVLYKIFYRAPDVVFSNQKLYFYRSQRPNSLMHSEYSRKNMVSMAVKKERAEFFRKLGEKELYRKAEYAYCLSLVVNLPLIRDHIEDSGELQRRLRKKARRLSVQLLFLPGVRVSRKVFLLVRAWIPGTQRVYAAWIRRKK